MTTLAEAPSEKPSPALRNRLAAGPTMATLFGAVFALAGIHQGLARLSDNSFMWHLRTGRYILDHGIPHSDPYSFTAAGTRWVAQSWLAELAYGIADKIDGPFGVRLLMAANGAVIGWLVFAIAAKAARDRIRGGLVGALVFICLLVVWSERPLIFGILAMLALVALVEFPEGRLGRRPYVALPVVMWLWANTHGTFALGFVYLGAHLVGRWLDGAPPTEGREQTLLRASVLAGVVTLANPYGLGLVLFPVQLMGRSSVLANVSEWQSPHFRDLGAQMFALLLATTFAVFARRGASRRDVVVTVLFVGLGLYAVRNVGLTAVALLPIVSRAVARDEEPPADRRRFHLYALIAVVLAAALFVSTANSEPSFDVSAYPEKAWQAIQDQHLEGKRILTTDKWGGYLILAAWPRQHVFYDDRYDMYPLAVSRDFNKILYVQDGFAQVLDKYEIDAVMWPAKSAPAHYLDLLAGWKRTYLDDVAVVYVRSSLLGS